MLFTFSFCFFFSFFLFIFANIITVWNTNSLSLRKKINLSIEFFFLLLSNGFLIYDYQPNLVFNRERERYRVGTIERQTRLLYLLTLILAHCLLLSVAVVVFIIMSFTYKHLVDGFFTFFSFHFIGFVFSFQIFIN